MTKQQQAILNTDWMDQGQDECMACGTLDDTHTWNCIYNEGGAA